MNPETRVRIESGRMYYIVSDDIIFLRSPVDEEVTNRTGMISDDIIFLRVPPGDSLSFRRDDLRSMDNHISIKLLKGLPGIVEPEVESTPTDEGDTPSDEPEGVPIVEEEVVMVADAEFRSPGDTDLKVNLRESTVMLNTKQLIILGVHRDEAGNDRKAIRCYLLEELDLLEISTAGDELQIFFKNDDNQPNR